MFEVKPHPELSWSISRHKTLMECPRKYGYDYYVSHNGWLRDADSLARHTYRLKKLTNLEMLFGSIVHDTIYQVIQHFLKTRQIPSEQKLVDRIRQQLNQGFIDSTRREHLWHDKPKHYTMLHEIYYSQQDKLPPNKTAKIQSRLGTAMNNFLKSQTFQDIQTPENIRFVASEDFRYMMIGDVKIYIVMDLVYRDINQDKWVIVDWKTGKASAEDRNQLALYALYLKQRYQIDSLDKIVIRNEYLLEGYHKEHALNATDLINVQNLFGMSIQEMSHYLADVEKNEPLSIDQFPKYQEDHKCARCNYQELCFG
ncbi:CRISPR/Cas system-associated exonuclease Cas4 (RecB family) [Thalassobacillus devorans]|nr:PD-(D/E)XK nuclease family protein [Thalassobacillus devorans]NIK29431.1 CRISPR/Cas system-associated exonuclease Cas4 (RecB family) [Thalassobacillus devorans]